MLHSIFMMESNLDKAQASKVINKKELNQLNNKTLLQVQWD
jgi:hypothetical protein